jgi:hypothetical protein
MARKFGPKTKDHPSVGELCSICNKPFAEGDYTTLIKSEPADEEEAKRKKAGLYYTSKATEIHWDHVAGEFFHE